jgi:hypothetical protein
MNPTGPIGRLGHPAPARPKRRPPRPSATSWPQSAADVGSAASYRSHAPGPFCQVTAYVPEAAAPRFISPSRPGPVLRQRRVRGAEHPRCAYTANRDDYECETLVDGKRLITQGAATTETSVEVTVCNDPAVGRPTRPARPPPVTRGTRSIRQHVRIPDRRGGQRAAAAGPS